MDALEYLIFDHKNHRELLQQVKSKEDFSKFRAELIHHVNMEEAILYPVLLKVGILEDKVRNAWEEHNLLMQLLQEMDSLSNTDKNWTAKLNVLSKLVHVHIDEEETELFPKIRQLASEAFLKEMKEKMQEQKKKTHPDEILYPDVPGSHHLD